MRPAAISFCFKGAVPDCGVRSVSCTHASHASPPHIDHLISSGSCCNPRRPHMGDPTKVHKWDLDTIYFN